MEIRELTEEMDRLVEAKGWYSIDSPKPQSPRNLAISLVLEASEVLELFQWQEDLPAKEDLGSELADVMLYLLQLASRSGIELESAVMEKIHQNYNREW